MYTVNLSASEYPIKSVTVFKSKAEVVRKFELELKSDQNKVEISDLPSDIDPKSVRVGGLGSARLFDVVCTSNPGGSDKSGDEALESIRLLNVKKTELESEKRIREHESELLVNWAKTITGEHVNYGDMPAFLRNFVEQGKENVEAVSIIKEKLVEIDHEIQRIKDKNEARKGSTVSMVSIVIGGDGDESITFDLSYIVTNASWLPTYELHASTASGQPTSSISLHYRAQVSQSTGEDWADADLTLSTFEMGGNYQGIPELLPLRIKPAMNQPGAFLARQINANINSAGGRGLLGGSMNPHTGASLFGQTVPQQQPSMQSMRPPQSAPPPQSVMPPQSGFGQLPQQQPGLPGGPGALPGLANLFGSTAPVSTAPSVSEDFVEIGSSESAEGDTIPNDSSKPTTIIAETPLSLSFAVEGQTTIPTDGLKHHVPIAVLPFDAEVSHVLVPRIKPLVYLQCRVKNTSEYRLLPGGVSVIMDGSYVSTISIDEVSKGDTFDCTLGIDPAMKVSYQRKCRSSKAHEGAFADTLNIATSTNTITILNKHQYTVSNLVIRECLPLSMADHRAKVVLRKPARLADAKDGEEVVLNKHVKVMWTKIVNGKGGEKDGMFEWHTEADGGDEIVTEAEWEVRTPAGEKWVESFDRKFA